MECFGVLRLSPSRSVQSRKSRVLVTREVSFLKGPQEESPRQWESYLRSSHLVVSLQAVIEGRGSVISRPLQATWPHTVDAKAAAWSSLAKLSKVTVF